MNRFARRIARCQERARARIARTVACSCKRKKARSQKIVHTWLDPIEILTATAAIYILVVFAVSALGKALADVLRRRYGLAAS